MARNEMMVDTGSNELWTLNYHYHGLQSESKVETSADYVMVKRKVLSELSFSRGMSDIEVVQSDHIEK